MSSDEENREEKAANNPAGRLYALLDKAGVPAKERDATKVRDRWAEVLEVNRSDLATLLERLSEVIALPSKIRAAIEDVPEEDKERFLAPLPKIEQAFGNLSLHSQWGRFARPITKDVMVGLDFCDWLLSRVSPEPALIKEQRERLQEQVRNLRDEVTAEEHDPPLREFLLHHLSEMDRALEMYRISGTRPLRKAVEATIGGAAIASTKGQMPSDNPRLKKLGALAAGILLLLNIGNEALQLTERVFGTPPQAVDVHIHVESDPGALEAEVVEGGDA